MHGDNAIDKCWHCPHEAHHLNLGGSCKMCDCYDMLKIEEQQGGYRVRCL